MLEEHLELLKDYENDTNSPAGDPPGTVEQQRERYAVLSCDASALLQTLLVANGNYTMACDSLDDVADVPDMSYDLIEELELSHIFTLEDVKEASADVAAWRNSPDGFEWAALHRALHAPVSNTP